MEYADVKRKPVKLKLVGIDGNVFALMGAWKHQARRERWTEEEIDAVLDEAATQDYSYALCVLGDNCNKGGF